MKTKSLFVPALLLAALISSCTVFSVHPLYLNENLVTDNRLNGLWKEDGDDNNQVYVKIEASKDKLYSLTYWEKEDTLWFDAFYLKLGEDCFMDLYPPKDRIPDLLLNNYFPVHSIQRILLSDGKMTVYMFDGEKMIRLFQQNRIRLRHELISTTGGGIRSDSDCVLITAGTEDLQKFIQKYSSNPEVFSDPIVFKKISP